MIGSAIPTRCSKGSLGRGGSDLPRHTRRAMTSSVTTIQAATGQSRPTNASTNATATPKISASRNRFAPKPPFVRSGATNQRDPSHRAARIPSKTTSRETVLRARAGALHAPRAQALRAYAHRAMGPMLVDSHRLQVGQPAAFRLVHRVTDVVAGHRTFSTDVAALSHR